MTIDKSILINRGMTMQIEDFDGKPLPEHTKYKYSECLAIPLCIEFHLPLQWA